MAQSSAVAVQGAPISLLGPSQPSERRRALRAVPFVEAELSRRLQDGDARAAVFVYQRVAKAVESAIASETVVVAEDRGDLERRTIERVIATIVSGRYRRQCSLASWSISIAHD